MFLIIISLMEQIFLSPVKNMKNSQRIREIQNLSFFKEYMYGTGTRKNVK
jgi:hypothetical protein